LQPFRIRRRPASSPCELTAFGEDGPILTDVPDPPALQQIYPAKIQQSAISRNLANDVPDEAVDALTVTKKNSKRFSVTQYEGEIIGPSKLLMIFMPVVKSDVL
jgi:hypothetical protein